MEDLVHRRMQDLQRHWFSDLQEMQRLRLSPNCVTRKRLRLQTMTLTTCKCVHSATNIRGSKGAFSAQPARAPLGISWTGQTTRSCGSGTSPTGMHCRDTTSGRTSTQRRCVPRRLRSCSTAVWAVLLYPAPPTRCRSQKMKPEWLSADEG